MIQNLILSGVMISLFYIIYLLTKFYSLFSSQKSFSEKAIIETSKIYELLTILLNEIKSSDTIAHERYQLLLEAFDKNFSTYSEQVLSSVKKDTSPEVLRNIALSLEKSSKYTHLMWKVLTEIHMEAVDGDSPINPDLKKIRKKRLDEIMDKPELDEKDIEDYVRITGIVNKAP